MAEFINNTEFEGKVAENVTVLPWTRQVINDIDGKPVENRTYTLKHRGTTKAGKPKLVWVGGPLRRERPAAQRQSHRVRNDLVAA